VKRASSWAGHGDLAASLVLIAPVVFAYEIGVLFVGRVNGADVVTRAIYGALGRQSYLLVYAAIAVGFLLWIRHTRRWGTLRAEVAAPVILEAAIYALTLGAVLTLVVHRLLGLQIGAGDVVSALGAGVHEELVFRLGLFAGGAALLARTGMTERPRVVIALVLSSLGFAAAHHLGAHGEPWSVHAFAFRTVAGIAFGSILWFRSLAHVVYAHVLYDIVVAAS
jgi:hypothetical protein